MTHAIHAAIRELEAKLLAAWVTGPAFRGRWTPVPEEFSTLKAQSVARVCAALAALGIVGDLTLAMDERLYACGDRSRYWQVDEAPLDSTLASGTPDADLQRWRELRCLASLASMTQEALRGIGPGSDLVATRNAILVALEKTSISAPAQTYSVGAGFTAAWEHATRRDPAGGFVGLPDIDRATGGIKPGHVWVLGAPTNWGKTSLLLGIADHYLSVHGSGVLLLTCEDEPVMLFGRWLAARARVKGTALRDARLSAPELQQCAEQVKWAAGGSKRPVMLDGRGRDVERLAEDIRAIVAQHGPMLVIADYLQCIPTQRKTKERRHEINHVFDTLVNVVSSTGCSGLFASQLTGEETRDSRDVEHRATVVLIGRKHESGDLELFVKKNKTGPKEFSVALAWDKITGSFTPHREMVEYGEFDNEADPLA